MSQYLERPAQHELAQQLDTMLESIGLGKTQDLLEGLINDLATDPSLEGFVRGDAANEALKNFIHVCKPRLDLANSQV